MYEITEALQQMIDRANNQVVQEVQAQQQTSALSVVGDMHADADTVAPWEIIWRTKAG